MNLSYKWLSDLVATGMSAEELGRKLTDAGCAVEEIEQLPGDTRLVAEVTTNRPDWLCHHGIARELSGMTGKPATLPEVTLEESGPDVNTLAAVRVEAPDLCPRYTARVIRDVTITESPDWLKARIEAVGLRPINNVVDITNYVLYETNQPLHAFDYDLLAEHTVVVRRAGDGETITAIDGTECRLTSSMLVIADAKKPVAIAGVMGGRESEVSEKTANVLLESAYFDPPSTRRTSQALKLASDSSYRFERGIDPGSVAEAGARACQLILELAGGTLATGIIDTAPELGQPWEVSMRYARCNQLLGFDVTREEVARVFSGLGLTIVADDDEKITVSVPSFRQDLTREIDLIEEVARLVGFDRVPSRLTMPMARGREAETAGLARTCRTVLAGLGYFECLADPFVPGEWLADFPVEGTPVRIENPVNARRPVLRTDLTPSLLEVRRVNRGEEDVRLFEIGRVYMDTASGRAEFLRLTLLDDRGTAYLRGALEALLHAAYLDAALSVEPADIGPAYADGSGARLLLDGEFAGTLGTLHAKQVALHDLNAAPSALQVDLVLMASRPRQLRRYVPLPKFPPVRRDIALVVPEEVAWRQVETIVREEPAHLESLHLESVYRGKGLQPGTKSVAFAVIYRAEDRSLTDEEANALRDKLVEKLTASIDGATLRAQ